VLKKRIFHGPFCRKNAYQIVEKVISLELLKLEGRILFRALKYKITGISEHEGKHLKASYEI